MLVRLPLHACEIDAAPDILTQILVNLVKNAVEALPRGGRIEIVNNGQVQRNGRAYYALSISDNGSGIPGEHRSQLFTPVRSSKSGSNRGIGLSIVHGLVKQLDGTIACVSTSTKGTLFELCLPLPGKPAQAAPTSAAQDFA
jgi:signal transduction histidine kinase